MVKNSPANSGNAGVWALGWEDTLVEEMATHSNFLDGKIPWTEEPGGLQSMGSQRVRHDWATEQQKQIHFTNKIWDFKMWVMKANRNPRKLDQPSQFQKYSLLTTSTRATNTIFIFEIYIYVMLLSTSGRYTKERQDGTLGNLLDLNSRDLRPSPYSPWLLRTFMSLFEKHIWSSLRCLPALRLKDLHQLRGIITQITCLLF